MRAPVLMYFCGPDPECLREILSGLEEEGVLCEACEYTGIAESLSEIAANESLLGCGIGIYADEAVMAVAGRTGGVFSIRSACPTQYRILGQNAARYVKRKPFVFGGDRD